MNSRCLLDRTGLFSPKILLDLLPVGVLVKNNNLKIVHANSKACSMFLDLGDRIAGEMPENFDLQKGDEEWKRAELQVLNSGRQVSLLRKHAADDTGNVYNVNISRLVTEKDNQRYIIITVQDALKFSKTAPRNDDSENYRSLFEEAPVAIVKSTPDGKLCGCNAAAARMLGFRNEEHVLREVSDLPRQIYVDPRQREKLVADLKDKGWATNRELHLRRRDGSRFWVSANLRHTRKCGKPYFSSFLFDISSAKAAEDVAISASLAKRRFLVNLSHAIKSPLSGLMGMLQLVQMAGLNQNNERFLCAAISAGDNLLNVVNNILDIYKIEAGMMHIRRQPFSVHEIVSTLDMRFRPQAEAKGLALETIVDPNAPGLLLGDELRLCQLLSSLVDNSIRYSDKGLVQIMAHCSPPHGPGDRLRLHFKIRDSGCGMPDCIRERICSPIVDDQTEFAKDSRGAGLGLLLAKNIANRMGGELSVAEGIRQGTEINVDIEAHLVSSTQFRRQELK